jgi:4-hydroxy-3-methylbut-2-enyl diphosphate reductase
MEVILAKSAGFCFGVKRAVDTVYKTLETKDCPVYTFGPIIHNEEVVKDLAEKGVRIVEGKENLKNCSDGIVIIRSHGVSKEIYDLLDEANISYVDATCPFVLKIHRLVEDHSKQGYHVIIVGDSHHPEVEGIQGWVQDGEATVISSAEEAKEFSVSMDTKLCIVSQTTFHTKKFQEIVEIFAIKGYNSNVLNTICNATQERQSEAQEIASQVDAMIVVGGKESSNTQKLFELCRQECENTFYIQTCEDLDLSKLRSIDCVGITAGASTPNKIIQEVQQNVRNEL